ncbi:NPCBM/NEW2 domain-containing protein [Deinococcus sp. QL22]|uniref:NPCBM/NEW2 domain-containing protein n=1 Tax=Deinococcus sp. QL22 TaxID=2939437 RepID=UPI0020183AC1|nr:NPCBM/NEW2 domain-containing protein [Deinococcus sp. QL22]UQN09755.1 NPCBM/NEW2 domain-containing protein [Deinococcus sp. QL22]
MSNKVVLGTLATLTVLMACSRPDGSQSQVPDPYAGGKSYPWSDRLDLPSADPYADGKSYPWTGIRTSAAGVQAQALGSGDNFLSDLTWTSATNAWGPIEQDRSNAEQAAGDGRPLTIGGQVFAKGLGVHAASEVSYTLGGMCNTFTASVGIDDEVGDRGSVVFQVWNGTATKLYDSGTVRGTDPAKPVSVNVAGVQNLRLVVTDGSDGISYDHGDWANAKVSCSAEESSGVKQLSDLTWTSATNAWGPVERDQSNGEQGAGDGRPLTIGGQVFTTGLGVHASSTLTYGLAGHCTVFTAQVGIDDEVSDRGSVVFQVWNGTAAKLYDSGTVRGIDAAKPVSVNLAGVQSLRLVVTDAANGIDYDHADWADARLTCGGDSTAPAAPSGLSASPQAGGTAVGGIMLDWADNTEPDLAGYRVYRAAQPGGLYSLITPQGLTASSFTDAYAPENAASYYRVVATDTSGNASGAALANALRPPAPVTSTYTYSALANQPYSVAESQGRMLNGRLYTFGGFDSLKGCCTPTNRAYLYDPATSLWTPLAPMPDKGATHAGLTTDGTSLYYAGGYLADSAWSGQIFGSKAVWRYDPASNTYTHLPDLPLERAAGQLEYLDGKLHYFGGTNLARTQNVGDHYVLDLTGAASSWTVSAPLPNPRHHMGSTVLGGKIYAVGGQHGHDQASVTQASLHAYDPATNTWTALQSLPRARSHISNTTFVLAGRLVVAGGESAHDRPISDVSAYNPATDTWTALTPLPVPRSSSVAGPAGQGFVYTGGNTQGGWLVLP